MVQPLPATIESPARSVRFVDVAKRFGDVTAVAGVNLDIEPVEKPEEVLWIDPIHKKS